MHARLAPVLAVLIVIAIGPAAAPPALAQGAPASAPRLQMPDPNNPFLGGVPSGDRTNAALPLTLKDAIARGLENNLGVLLQEASVTSARGARWNALAGLLPNVSGRLGEARRLTSLAEFGFTDFPGLTSRTVGPFNVFDTRLDVTQSVLDVNAIYQARAGAAGVKAAEHSVRNARDLVVLVVANLYLDGVAAGSRVEAARAQLNTADTLLQLAQDLKQAGMTAGIDVLRAQVQQQSARQRVIVAGNDLAKTKLQLGRAIGLPPGQELTLVDRMPYAPLQQIGVDDAVKRALSTRGDYLAAQAQVSAAEFTVKAADAEWWPSLEVSGEIARVGPAPSSTDFTYAVAASVRVPVFERGRAVAHRLQAEAELAQRKASLADLGASIEVEVRSALLDVKAAEQELEAARTGQDLATQQLAQTRDRFAAGVAGSVEVVQAQDALAAANESYIAALYAHNLAKATLARAIGVAEEATQTYLGGVQ
jgi:outer membrane protein TolC